MLLRSTLIYAPAIILPRLAAIVLLIVVTRLVDQTEYGLLALVVTVGEMADITISNWLRVALIRLGGSARMTVGAVRRGAGAMLSTTLVAVLMAVVVALLVVPERWQEFALAAALYVSVGNVLRFGLTVLQIQERRLTYTFLEAARAALSVALPIAALLLVAPNFLVASIAASIATVAVGTLAVILGWRGSRDGPAPFTVRDLVVLGTPLVVLALLSVTMGSVDRILIKLFMDAGAVGVFAAAYALARQPVDVLSNAINQGGYPELVRRFDTYGEADASLFVAQQLAFTAKLVIPAAAVLIVLSGDFIALVLPENYRAEAESVFWMITVAVVCLNLKTFVFDNVFNVYKRNWLQAASLLPGAILSVSMGLLLIPWLGLPGAGWAYLIAAVASLLFSIVVSRRLNRVPVPYLDLATAAIVAIASAGTAYVAQQEVHSDQVLVRLLAGGIGGGTAFLILSAVTNWNTARALILSMGNPR